MTEILDELDLIVKNFSALKSIVHEIQDVANQCVQTMLAGNKIMFCGNGGSASQAQHLAAELVGRYKMDRPPMNAMSLTVDTSILTAVGNDYEFNDIFSRQVEGIGKKGDLLFGLSTSGKSENVVRAFESAKKMKLTTIAMTGSEPARMANADIVLAVPSRDSNHIQEMHLAIGHWICGEIERNIFHGR